MSDFKLGRRGRSYNPAIPHMSALLAGRLLLPAIPPKVDWTVGLPADLGQMLNNSLGDCTCAAFYHAIQVWSFNAAGTVITEPDADVLKLYELACGYNPTEGGEGGGGVEQDVLTYLLRNGAPTGPDGTTVDRIAAFVEVDARNLDDVKRTISDCGVAYIGFEVPEFLMQNGPPEVWDINNDGDQHPMGGHAVILAGYDDSTQTFKVISWGRVYQMTYRFFQAFTEEVYALADVDFINAKGTTPAGLPLATLEAQMQTLRG